MPTEFLAHNGDAIHQQTKVAVTGCPKVRKTTHSSSLVADGQRPLRGLLDTSVVIDLELLGPEDLPAELAVSAITMVELATGPEAALDPQERARRIVLIQHVEDTFDQLPFDLAAARVYGRVYAAVIAAGRKARGRRAMDLLIAATALSNELPLYTHNLDDFAGLEGLLDIVAVPA